MSCLCTRKGAAREPGRLCGLEGGGGGWRQEGEVWVSKVPLKKVLLKGPSAKKNKREESKANMLTLERAPLSCVLLSRRCSHSLNRNGAQRRLSGTFVSCAQGQLAGCGLLAHTWAALRWGSNIIYVIAHNLWNGEKAAAHACGIPRSAAHQHCSWHWCKTKPMQVGATFHVLISLPASTGGGGLHGEP